MIIKNEENIQVPDFLNEDFFIKTLEEGFRLDNVKINELIFEWGSNPGDNYCSAIYRVKLSYERQRNNSEKVQRKQSLIVKTIPITPHTQFLDDVEVFLKEKVTYQDILPRLEILSENETFGAKYFYSMAKPIQTIVFDDLKVQGYRTASRQDCLDWNHASLVLRKLGKFHATSMALAKKDPTIMKRFTKGMLCPDTVINTNTFRQMFGSSLEQLVKTCAEWPGFEKMAPHLQRYLDNFNVITSKLAMPKPNDKFVVLCHGDMWTNNFMFAYDDPNEPNNPTRAVFVDFQLSFYGSPGCDVNFFLNTSVQLPVLKTRRNDLIMEYYETLKETLEYLRYDEIPSLEDLNLELRNRELYGLFALFGFLPMVTLPPELSGDSSIESMSDENHQREKLAKVFAQPKLAEALQFGLKRLDQLGVFQEI